ncbi:MAG: hypothetical protein RLZZ546_1760 [Bacteroidota bacterium]|jgi:hypothetical protein
MPHIPIPPQMTVTQRLQALTTNTTGVGVTNIVQPNSNVAQQIKDVAEQQARMVLDEWLKSNKDLFEARENKLKIQNIKNIVGQWYDNTYNIIGVAEWDTNYQFTLGNDTIPQRETILLHRRQTDSGHYIMEYNGKTLWLLRDEFDTIEKIIICMRTI